jgi:photosystem II stability/assembly factor-like uncharacterized protein
MRIRSALLAALLAGAPLAAAPQWTALGPYGGGVDTLTVDPVDARVLYATANLNGTFKSVDGGATWRLIHAGYASSKLVVDPSRHTTIYQTLGYLQVLKSTDGGITWSASSRGLTRDVSCVAVDPVKPKRIYAGGSTGVWHSLDGGFSWQAARRPLPLGDARVVHALVASPRPAGTVYAATNGGLFKSVNAGASWQRVSRGLPPGPVTVLAPAPANPQILWATVYGAGVFRSTNGGASWRPTAALPDEVISLAVAAGNPSQAWAGTWGRGAYRTTDAGAHWTAVGLRPDGKVGALAAAGTSLYASLAPDLHNPGGVLASGDGGATWQPRNTGLTTQQALDVAIDPHHPNVLWAATGMTGLYRSTVGGQAWDLATQPPVPPDVPLIAPFTGVAFSSDGAILYTLFNGGLWTSDDAGVSWRLVLGPETTTPRAFVSLLLTDSQDAATLYAKGVSGFFASHDSGATWQALNPGFDCSFNTLAIAPSAPATLYAGGAMNSASPSFGCHLTRAALVRSTDGGATWTRADSGLAGEGVLSLAVDPLDPRILYATSGGRFGNPTGVSKSLDGGATWSELGPPIVSNLLFSAGGGTLWGSDDLHVFASRDGGASWRPMGGPQGFINRLVADPADPGRLYAAASGGIWVLEDRP